MTTMQQLSASQASPEVPINENFETLEHQGVYGKRHAVTTGLTWGYYGGRWGGFSVAAGTLALTASNTNYNVVAVATGVPSVSTSSTNWDDIVNYRRVYKITTGGSTVSSVEDHRAGPGGVHGPEPVAFALGDLTDVDLEGSSDAPAHGDVLTYDDDLGAWLAVAPTLAALSDVNVTGSMAPDDQDTLVFDSGAGKWIATPASALAPGTAGVHSIPIMASSMGPSVAGGCAALASVASAANQPDIVTLDFDASTAEYAQFSIPMPKKWNEGTVTAKFVWSHAATTTDFGVVWGLQGVAVSDGDAIAAAFGTAQEVADTGGTTDDLYITAATAAITIAGSPAAEDVVFFRVYRLPTDGSDTMAIDARLHAVVLYITTDAETDA